jgi:thioester reductase-like protein
MHLSSFEKGNIAGVSHLLSLCQASSGSTTMNFCSSVSTCSRATVQPVPESLSELEWAQGMGYAQSKSVAEQLCAKAAAQGITVRVLRVGQICGDTQHGIWNAQEAIPMMIQTALTVGALPKLSEMPSWLPVDVVAHAVIDISLSKAGSLFANVVNPRKFSWIGDFIPALQMAGLEFNLVEPREWVARLRQSDHDPSRNPPIKLVEFFASKYDVEIPEPSKEYATDIAIKWSPILANTPALTQDLVDKFVRYFTTECWLSK